MKLDVCDLCFAGDYRMVAGETLVMSVDGNVGELDLCANHRSELQSALTSFIEVSRIAPGDARRCQECGFVSASRDAANKHRRMHEAARERQRALQHPQRQERVPEAFAATG